MKKIINKGYNVSPNKDIFLHDNIFYWGHVGLPSHTQELYFEKEWFILENEHAIYFLAKFLYTGEALIEMMDELHDEGYNINSLCATMIFLGLDITREREMRGALSNLEEENAIHLIEELVNRTY